MKNTGISPVTAERKYRNAFMITGEKEESAEKKEVFVSCPARPENLFHIWKLTDVGMW